LAFASEWLAVGSDCEGSYGITPVNRKFSESIAIVALTGSSKSEMLI
jgi:hypothetical protein